MIESLSPLTTWTLLACLAAAGWTVAVAVKRLRRRRRVWRVSERTAARYREQAALDGEPDGG